MSKIDTDFIAMIQLLAKASTNNDIQCTEYNAEKVLKYAKEQSVLPLICSIITEYSDKCNKLILGAVTKNISDSTYILSILCELKQNGINFTILKGESISILYKNPQLRISGDIDLLVDKKDEQAALDIFSSHGYEYKKRAYWKNETALFHKIRKMVEIHISLHDKTREDLFFGNIGDITEPTMTITTENLGEINVLSPNDGIMFLYLHFVKHFLSSGAGIRQLLDVAIYSKHYKNEINWTSFFEKLSSVHYLQLYEYILSTAVKYMGFSKKDFPDVNYSFDKADIVVSDLQYCGAFGHNDADLEKFKNIYEQKRNEKYGFVDYSKYKKRYNSSILHMVFPPAKIMKERYLYLNKYSYLLPISWVQRILTAAIGILTKRNNLKKYTSINTLHTNDAIDNRMKLMEELDII